MGKPFNCTQYIKSCFFLLQVTREQWYEFLVQQCYGGNALQLALYYTRSVITILTPTVCSLYKDARKLYHNYRFQKEQTNFKKLSNCRDSAFCGMLSCQRLPSCRLHESSNWHSSEYNLLNFNSDFVSLKVLISIPTDQFWPPLKKVSILVSAGRGPLDKFYWSLNSASQENPRYIVFCS